MLQEGRKDAEAAGSDIGAAGEKLDEKKVEDKVKQRVVSMSQTS